MDSEEDDQEKIGGLVIKIITPSTRPVYLHRQNPQDEPSGRGILAMTTPRCGRQSVHWGHLNALSQEPGRLAGSDGQRFFSQ